MKREQRSKMREGFDSEQNTKHSPKKSLGQHFLTDPNILDKIVRAGDVTAQDLILEIGPGEGPLTESLLRAGATVIAVEKDDSLIPLLQEKFSDEIKSGKLILNHGDILDARAELENVLGHKNYKVVANIPYYITGKIIRFLFSLESLPGSIILLVQDEVAKRIVSDKESLLSLSIKAFGTPSYRGKVKAGSFSPPPKVDSAILSIDNISRDFFLEVSEDVFFETIRRSFSQKRKTLLNTLFSNKKKKGEEILHALKLSSTVRPEEINLDTWKQLIQSLHASE